MEKIFEIEEKYGHAKDLQAGSIRIWPVYRIILRFLLLNSKKQQPIGETRLPATPPGISFLRKGYHALKHIGKIASGLPDFYKWTRTYEYVIFSNDLEQRQVNGMTIDKLATGLIEQLGEKKTLLVNYPSGNGSGRTGNLKHRNFVNGGLINSATALARRTKVTISGNDRQWIDKICNDYQLSTDGLEQIEYFFRKVKVINWLLKRWKPRLVINCCYTYHAEVYAAKQRGVRTIELQHGIISPLHPGYESKLAINKDFTAEFLLSFGENSTRDLSGHIVDLSKVMPIGNLYLEEMFHSPPDPYIQALTGAFERSVCIPTDAITEDEIVEFILSLAKRDPDIGYFIVPRLDMFERNVARASQAGNIKILKGQSFQNVVRHCSVHTATISTCCLEALSLGIPNILINTDGRTGDIYRGMVDDRYTFFVTDVDGYFQSLEKLKKFSKEDIRNSNYRNFSNHYQDNLTKALRILQS